MVLNDETDAFIGLKNKGLITFIMIDMFRNRGESYERI